MPFSLPAHQIFPVVLCGGSGTRLWPVSRELYPKPFVALSTGESLFRSTLERLKNLPNCNQPVIVTNEEHRFYVLDTLEESRMEGSIILEPEPRNTAPAIYMAALLLREQGNADSLMLIMPSDHYLGDNAIFQNTIKNVVATALSDAIITFGITPTRPDTAYGYIKAGIDHDSVCKKVASFIEKPSADNAASMLKEGGYYWNSGVFFCKPSVLIAEMKKYRPDIAAACDKAWDKKNRDNTFIRPEPDSFMVIPEESIDYAIMEKTDIAVMASLSCAWNDMGSWESFYQEGSRDDADNVLVGDVLLEDVDNSYIYSRGRLIAAVGVKDMAIIDSGDAVLVIPRQRCQEVKKIVKRLKAENREEAQLHPVVYRPWGSYERLSMGDRFQVKRIIVKPGCSLSLQMHHHRSEHWIIVRGTAEITIGDERKLHTENQSVYIPLGYLHKLYNPGKIPLELIEVQSGSYLGENDIVRIEDKYGRK